MYFCQRILEKWLRSLSLTAQSRLLNERSGVAVLDVHRYKTKVVESNPATIDYHYAYVDKMGVFAARVDTVTDELDKAKTLFESQGLLLHEIELHSGGADTLGVAVGTLGLFTAPTAKRLRVFRRGLGAFLSLSYCTGEIVEVLLGLCTYAALTCRLLMCVFRASHAFVQKAGKDAWRI